MINEKVFLVGMPRSGTTSLMKLLNSNKDIVAFGESLFWGRLYLKPINGDFYSKEQLYTLHELYISRNWINEFNDSQKLVFEEELTLGIRNFLIDSEVTPKLFFDLLCKVFQTTFKKKYSIEKTPHHIHNIDRIRSYYPNAKFIITIRDPYDFILSCKFQGSQSNSTIREKFKRTYHPLQAALIFRKYLNSINKFKNSDYVLILNIEALKNENGIKKLSSFLKINSNDLGIYKKDNSSFSKMNVKPKLDKVDVFWANLVLKNYLKENAQYQNSNCDFMTIVLSSLKLPISLFYNIYFLNLAKGQTKLK